MSKEPDVIRFDVNLADGKFSKDKLKSFCKEKGYNLVKVEEH